MTDRPNGPTTDTPSHREASLRIIIIMRITMIMKIIMIITIIILIIVINNIDNNKTEKIK